MELANSLSANHSMQPSTTRDHDDSDASRSLSSRKKHRNRRKKNRKLRQPGKDQATIESIVLSDDDDDPDWTPPSERRQLKQAEVKKSPSSTSEVPKGRSKSVMWGLKKDSDLSSLSRLTKRAQPPVPLAVFAQIELQGGHHHVVVHESEADAAAWRSKVSSLKLAGIRIHPWLPAGERKSPRRPTAKAPVQPAGPTKKESSPSSPSPSSSVPASRTSPPVSPNNASAADRTTSARASTPAANVETAAASHSFASATHSPLEPLCTSFERAIAAVTKAFQDTIQSLIRFSEGRPLPADPSHSSHNCGPSSCQRSWHCSSHPRACCQLAQ